MSHTDNRISRYLEKDDIILCEICGVQAVDLHHILYKSQGGGDEVDNIIALCRQCHDKAHNMQFTPDYLREIHKKYL